MAQPTNLRAAMAELLSSYHDFNVNFVESFDGAPTSLEFLRCVQKNRPVIFRGAISQWKALKDWNSDYLCAKMGSDPVMIAETPLGSGASVSTQSSRADMGDVGTQTRPLSVSRMGANTLSSRIKN